MSTYVGMDEPKCSENLIDFNAVDSEKKRKCFALLIPASQTHF